MGVEKNIVAIELGSSSVRGIIGQRRSDGSLHILGYEKEYMPDAIRKGVVYNIDKTVAAITAIKSRIEERQKVYVNRVYVGLAGQSLHTVGNTVKRQLDVHVAINEDIVDSLMDENRAKSYGEAEILDVLPQEYRVGNRPTNDPAGIMADRIEGIYKNVVARRALRESIQRVMQTAKLDVVDVFISPLLLAAYILTDTEKRSGCALVDFGAETTTIAVYEKNVLRHLAVIPLGGNNITNDLATSLHIETDEAESIKRRLGSAWTDEQDVTTPVYVDITGDRKVNEKDILNIIEARQQEILANVWEQIKNYEDRLLSGVIFTGGAANIRNLETAFVQYSHFEKVKTRTMPPSGEFATSLKLDYQNNNLATLVAMLRRGDVECTSEKPLEPDLFEDPKQAENTTPTPATTPTGEGIVNTREAEEPAPAADVPTAETVEEKPEEEQKPAEPKSPGAFAKFSRWLRDKATELVDAN